MHRDPRVDRRVGHPASSAAAFVFLALAGEWTAHAATWYLTGGATPGQALSGTLHTYLEPVGLVLAGLAAVASWSVWRALQRLRGVARSIEAVVRRAWRDQPRQSEPRGPGADMGRAAGWGTSRVGPARLWAALFVVQLLVYFVQENVEAHAAGFGTPGLHVLTAHCGSAVAVHAAIALLGAMVVVEIGDHWVARRQAVEVAMSAYQAVTWRRALAPVAARPRVTLLGPPLERVGRSVLSRPPPLLLSA